MTDLADLPGSILVRIGGRNNIIRITSFLIRVARNVRLQHPF